MGLTHPINPEILAGYLQYAQQMNGVTQQAIYNGPQVNSKPGLPVSLHTQ